MTVQLFTELEKEALDEIEPEEMFSMDTASGDQSPATSTSFEQTHAASSNASAPSQYPVYTAWTPAAAASFGQESAAQHASSAGVAVSTPAEGWRRGVQLSSNRRNSTDSNSSYGDMPTAMAEQVGPPIQAPLISCSLPKPVRSHCPPVHKFQ